MILGSNAAVPVRNRFPSAQVLTTDHSSYLIDCGEGTQMQMIKYNVRPSRISHIFISHLHGDHIFGLPGLITSYSLYRRTSTLYLYGPKGIEEFIDSSLKCVDSTLSFQLKIMEHNAESSQVILNTDHIRVTTLPLDHRVPTSGFLFEEVLPKRRMKKNVVEEYQIPFEVIDDLRNGLDFFTADGRVIRNEVLTRPGRKPHSFAYCSDTGFYPALVPRILNVELLYHEATFAHDLRDKANARKHSTAHQAANIAKAANAGYLLIGHFSSRYKELSPLLSEARSIFPHSILAVEGLFIYFDDLAKHI